MDDFVDLDSLVDHSSLVKISKKAKVMDYKKNHRILAEGNFILTINEGDNDGVNTSFYDLFRVKNNKIVEHWDTTEKVPPKSDWKNDNGKF